MSDILPNNVEIKAKMIPMISPMTIPITAVIFAADTIPIRFKTGI
jgi:hypothetical protein